MIPDTKNTKVQKLQFSEYKDKSNFILEMVIFWAKKGNKDVPSHPMPFPVLWLFFTKTVSFVKVYGIIFLK